jgi:hypothetical protein
MPLIPPDPLGLRIVIEHILNRRREFQQALQDAVQRAGVVVSVLVIGTVWVVFALAKVFGEKLDGTSLHACREHVGPFTIPAVVIGATQLYLTMYPANGGFGEVFFIPVMLLTGFFAIPILVAWLVLELIFGNLFVWVFTLSVSVYYYLFLRNVDPPPMHPIARRPVLLPIRFCIDPGFWGDLYAVPPWVRLFPDDADVVGQLTVANITWQEVVRVLCDMGYTLHSTTTTSDNTHSGGRIFSYLVMTFQYRESFNRPHPAL